MHEYLKEAREGAARKLKGIQKGEPHTKVDSSSWSPPDMLEADKQNGMRPVSPRQYKSGGKVTGIHAKKRADRKARKEGGRAMSVDGYINRDSKIANVEREGVKKIGGMKRGGRAHKGDGGIADLIRQDEIEQGMKGRGLPERIPMPTPRPADKPVKYTGPKPTTNPNTGYKKGGAAHPDVAEDKALIRKMVKPSARTGKAEGGRTAKKRGGALGKGKTNVNIMIHPHSGMSQPPVMPPMGGPMIPPPPPPRPPMPPMGGAPMGGAPELPPMGAARPGMPPIGRKNGGKIPAGMKTRHVIDNAAGGGLGRLEKIKAYGLD